MYWGMCVLTYCINIKTEICIKCWVKAQKKDERVNKVLREKQEFYQVVIWEERHWRSNEWMNTFAKPWNFRRWRTFERMRRNLVEQITVECFWNWSIWISWGLVKNLYSYVLFQNYRIRISETKHRDLYFKFLKVIVNISNETEQDPVWLLGTEVILCPLLHVCREQTPASMTLPGSQGAGSNTC